MPRPSSWPTSRSRATTTSLEKVVADFKQKGIEITEHRVRKHMTELLDTARKQVMGEVK